MGVERQLLPVANRQPEAGGSRQHSPTGLDASCDTHAGLRGEAQEPPGAAAHIQEPASGEAD